MNTIVYLNDKRNNYKNPNHFLHIVFFLYWAVLVIWQNIGEYTAGTTIDTVLKMILLASLAISYFLNIQNAKIDWIYFLLLLIFIITQMTTFYLDGNFSLSIIVSYVFPSLLLFLSCVYGSNYKISKKEYVIFLNCVIVVVAYTAIYAVIFKTEQFLSAFSISSAYGNELSSFFVSNHEYGMYLIAGIVGCIVCLELKKDEPLKRKLIYLLCILLFIPNLILTYSRTSIFAMVGFLIVYIMFTGKSKTKILFIIGVAVIVIVFALFDTFREFVLKIVLKENNLAGRDDLYKTAIEHFKNGKPIQKLFGRGIQASREYLESATSHESVHNAYLQVLLYFGILGLTFMISFIVCRAIAAIKLIKTNRFFGVLSLGLVAVCSLIMFSNTAFIFNSPIDSFFLTTFTILMPKYLENEIKNI